MSTTTFIYALCEPNSRAVRYIGKANKPKRRLQGHLSKSIRAKTHLGNWLRILVANGTKPAMVVLREVSVEQWKMAEERYICLARGLGMRLVNATDGGEGITMTPEIRSKISASRRGQKVSPETRAKIGASLTGELNYLFRRKLTSETRAKISASMTGPLHHMFGKKQSPETIAKRVAKMTGALNPMFGKKQSPETLVKRSAAMTGKKHSPETCAKISASKTGKKRSLETRAKISTSMRAFNSLK